MSARFTQLTVVSFMGLVGVSAAASAADLTSAFRTHWGLSDMDALGFAVAVIGDIDQDGVADYAAGAPGWSLASGRAYVYSGSSGEQLYAFYGPGTTALFGFAVANAGDVNADGIDDFMVSAPVHIIGLESLGSVQVRSGADGEVLHWLYGSVNDGGFGWSMTSVGDLNDDGYADFAIASPFADSGFVEVFSGLSGSVIRVFAYNFGNNAQTGRSMANVGDVTGDGYDDLVIGVPGADSAYAWDLKDHQVIRLFTNGIASSGFGRAVASASDLDNDGIPDVIIGAPGAGKAYVYSPVIDVPLYVLSGYESFGGAVGSVPDFNGDGVSDLVVGSTAQSFGRVDVFSGAGGQIIWSTSMASGTGLGTAVTGMQDFTGDGYGELLVGYPGLIAANGASGAVHLFSGLPTVFGLSSAQFHPMTGTTPVSILTTDMNGDGYTDIIALSNTRLHVYTNNGIGQFPQPVTYTTSNATGMAIADIDADDRPDLIVTGLSMPQVRILRNTADGLVFSGKLEGPTMPLSIVTGDFNNDSRIDVAVTDYATNAVHVWLGKSSTSPMLSKRFTYSATYATAGAPIQVQAVHLNADAFLDLAVLNKDSSTVSIFSNKGTGKFNIRPLLPLEGVPYCMTFADFNGDGRQDLATVVAGSNKVSIRKGKPGFVFADPKFYGVGSGPRAVIARDINGDQQMDLITANWTSDVVTVRLKRGGGFAPAINQNAGLDPICIATGDFDFDGDMDIATVNKFGPSVSIVRNNLVE